MPRKRARQSRNKWWWAAAAAVAVVGRFAARKTEEDGWRGDDGAADLLRGLPPSGCDVDAAAAISLRDFEAEYRGKKPLLLRGAAAHWPALNKWTRPYLLEHFGDRAANVGTGSDIIYAGGGAAYHATLRDLLRRMRNGSDAVAFDARLLALTALANCLEVDLENCRRFECAPLAARLASLLKTIGFEDDSDDWRVEDVLEAAHCAVPLACVARREAGRTKALAALTGAAVAPTALAKLLEALAVVQARSGALDGDTAAALAVLVRDLRKLFPGAPATPEPKRARQQASPVGVETPTSDVVLPPPPPRTP